MGPSPGGPDSAVVDTPPCTGWRNSSPGTSTRRPRDLHPARGRRGASAVRSRRTSSTVGAGAAARTSVPPSSSGSSRPTTAGAVKMASAGSPRSSTRASCRPLSPPDDDPQAESTELGADPPIQSPSRRQIQSPSRRRGRYAQRVGVPLDPGSTTRLPDASRRDSLHHSAAVAGPPKAFSASSPARPDGAWPGPPRASAPPPAGRHHASDARPDTAGSSTAHRRYLRSKRTRRTGQVAPQPAPDLHSLTLRFYRRTAAG